MQPEEFIEKYEKALRSQNWKIVEPLFHKNVCVTFSNGMVHQGKSKVKVAFEKNFKMIENEEYSVQNVRWVEKNTHVAIYLFDFYWKGVIKGKIAKGSGIGTSVLVKEKGSWLLITENLGKQAN